MINVLRLVGKQYVHAHYPENDDEEKAQQELVRISESAQSRYQRVGLWILAEIKLNGRDIVLTSVNEKVDLDEKDLAWFRTAIVEKLI